jgi:hypothetical protein
MQFDRNGVFVRQSQPVRRLKKITKIVTIDSRDRDVTKYVKVNGGASSSDSGDYVVYFPRVYENVTRIRLKNASIQAPTSGWLASDLYVLLDLEGLNKADETATGANRAGFVDSWFAKLPNDTGFPIAAATVSATAGTGSLMTYTTLVPHGFSPGQVVTVTGVATAGYNVTNAVISTVPTTTTFTVVGTETGASGTGTATLPGILYYNDNSYDENIASYQPPIGRLDRMHVRIRRHPASVITSATTSVDAPITFGSGVENTLTFEIEYLDNVFEDVSSFETQLDARGIESNIYTTGRGY